jgi:hypothetical protein
MTRLRLTLLALFVLAAGPAFAQASVAGDWLLSVTSPQGTNSTKMTFKQEGEKVTGLFKGPAGELPVTGTLIGNDLTFTFTIQVQGMPLDVTMTGKLEDEKLSGKANFGGFAEGDWTGKRAEAAEATPTPPSTSTTTTESTTSTSTSTAVVAAGKWDVVVKTPGGELPASATLTEEAGKLSGTFGSQMGEVPVTGTVEGRAVKLTLIAQTPQGSMTVLLTGDIDGDAIVNGKAEIAGMGQMEWSAKRAKP